ncbi:hypothetical protein K4G64_39575, partial [Streptomyces sp. WAC04114]|nr:hypothetical protein [Streptomyces sp. WAC04114]
MALRPPEHLHLRHRNLLVLRRAVGAAHDHVDLDDVVHVRFHDLYTAVVGRAGVALAAGAAVLATAVPANAASYSAFAFSRSSSQPTIYDFINSATTSLDMTMYELKDTTAVNDLIALKNKGVTVRVILDGAHKSANQSAYNALTSAGAGVVWSSSTFVYTHQKTVTADGAKSLILTG